MKSKQSLLKDGVELWQCSTCHNWLASGHFYSDKRAPNGLKNQCKPCHNLTAIATRNPDLKRICNRESMRKRRSLDPQKYRDIAKRERLSPKTRHKVLARKQLSSKVHRGKIVKPSACECCGSVEMLHGHHMDYGKPYDVKWLCIRCHTLLHRD